MKKAAILIHQYGDRIVGGAENYARELAEHLIGTCDVTVLTSSSSDYSTWANDFEPGESVINGVRVLRFPAITTRNSKFGEFCGTLAPRLDGGGSSTYAEDRKWAEWEGPNCPDLITYIKDHHDDFDVFIFITYIYYVAIYGIPVVFDKAIFIPTAHDETWLRLEIMKDLFIMPRYFGFLTVEERDLVHERFKNEYIPSDVLGIGIDIPKDVDAERFKKKFGLSDTPYIIYVGRLDAAKGCDELITFFLDYKKEHPSKLKLVFVGTGKMQVPESADIVKTGFVSDGEKYDAISGALSMVTPSKYESLCISLLEALALKVPVIANAKCEVLRGQCIRSNGGLYYDGEYQFFQILDYMIEHPEERRLMGESGFTYIEDQYRWPQVVEKVSRMINCVVEANRKINDLDESLDVTPYKILADSDETQVEPVWEDAITIVTSSDNYYADFAAGTIHSIIMNSTESRHYDVIVLTNNITDEKIKAIHSLILNRLNFSVRYIYLSQVIHQLNIKISENYNEVTYFRLLIPQMMKKYHKIIYLDSDIVVNSNIDNFWDEDIGDKLLAGTWDPLATAWQMYDNGSRTYFNMLGLASAGKYIQAGVIELNITELNKLYAPNFLIRQSCEQRWLLADQDILNVYCKGRISYIDHAWNVRNYTQEIFEICRDHLPRYLLRQEMAAIANPKAIHYCESSFPCWKTDRIFSSIYYRYVWNTAFYDSLIEKRIDRIDELILEENGKKKAKKIRDTVKMQPKFEKYEDAVGIDLIPIIEYNEKVERNIKMIIIHPGGKIYGPGMQLGKGIHRFFITAESGNYDLEGEYKIVGELGRANIYSGTFRRGKQNWLIDCSVNHMDVEVLIENTTNKDIIISKLFL